MKRFYGTKIQIDDTKNVGRFKRFLMKLGETMHILKPVEKVKEPDWPSAGVFRRGDSGGVLTEHYLEGVTRVSDRNGQRTYYPKR